MNFILEYRGTLLPVAQLIQEVLDVYNSLTISIFPCKYPVSQSDYWKEFFYTSSYSFKHLNNYIKKFLWKTIKAKLLLLLPGESTMG